MCDFRTGFKPPEMVKMRPVVVVSGKRTGVGTVVPLSATAPQRSNQAQPSELRLAQLSVLAPASPQARMRIAGGEAALPQDARPVPSVERSSCRSGRAYGTIFL